MVGQALENGKKFLMSTQKSILSAAFIISITYGLSAILSLFRSRLLASHFGISDDLTIFYTADKIPSLIYSLIVLGTISTVFIPVFTELLVKDKEDAWRTASSIVNLALVVFFLLGSIVAIFAPEIIQLLSVGRFTTSQNQLGAGLMRVMISAQFILVISSFVTSLLQSFKHFVLPALAPIFYNVGMILGIVLLTPFYGIYGPAYGVFIGALLHLLIQLPLLPKIKLKYAFIFDFKEKGAKEIFSLIPSRLLGSVLIQFSGILTNTLAILISNSAVVVYKFADQLQSFPVNLFGASMALAALPTLSTEAASKNKQEFKKTFLTSFHQMMYLVIPASVILLVLRVPVVRIVFGAREFPWDATLETAATLGLFSISIFAQSAVFLVTRAFYALKDMSTPVKVNALTVFLSFTLSLFFVKSMGLGVWSLAISYTVGSLLDLLLLMHILDKKVEHFARKDLFVPLAKISLATLLMGVFLYLPMKALDAFVFDTTRTLPLVVLTLIVTLVGGSVYLLLTKLLKVEEIQLFYKLLAKFEIKRLKIDPILSGTQRNPL